MHVDADHFGVHEERASLDWLDEGVLAKILSACSRDSVFYVERSLRKYELRPMRGLLTCPKISLSGRPRQRLVAGNQCLHIQEHRSHFGSRYKLGCCGHAGLLLPLGKLAPVQAPRTC